MRKLLHQIYGILKSGMPYDPNKRGFQNTSSIAQKTAVKNGSSIREKNMKEFGVR